MSSDDELYRDLDEMHTLTLNAITDIEGIEVDTARRNLPTLSEAAAEAETALTDLADLLESALEAIPESSPEGAL